LHVHTGHYSGHQTGSTQRGHKAATKTRLKAAHPKAQAEGLGTVQHPVIPKAQRAVTPSLRFSWSFKNGGIFVGRAPASH
jgi:hypothetical protein